MNERRILNQIVSSNNGFHPIIGNSKLCIDDKVSLQYVLDNYFNGDFRALIEDMLEHAIENEEYEMAVVIRDELNK